MSYVATYARSLERIADALEELVKVVKGRQPVDYRPYPPPSVPAPKPITYPSPPVTWPAPPATTVVWSVTTDGEVTGR